MMRCKGPLPPFDVLFMVYLGRELRMPKGRSQPILNVTPRGFWAGLVRASTTHRPHCPKATPVPPPPITELHLRAVSKGVEGLPLLFPSPQIVAPLLGSWRPRYIESESCPVALRWMLESRPGPHPHPASLQCFTQGAFHRRRSLFRNLHHSPTRLPQTPSYFGN